MKTRTGTTSHTISDVRNAIRRMAADANAMLLHSETLRDVRNLHKLSNDRVVDLHWEIYHTLND